MRILFMPNNVAPVNFWRMKQFADTMTKKGVNVALYKFDPKSDTAGAWEGHYMADPAVRDEIFSLYRYSDIVVMGYLHFPQPLALMIFRESLKSLKKHGYDEATAKDILNQTKGPKKILCEIDDLVLDTPTYNPAYKGGYKQGGAYEKVAIEHMKQANGIINSTDYLAKRHVKYNKNSFTVPNCIDLKAWDVPKKKSKRLRIGWIGGGNHQEDLRILENPIKDILKKYKDIEFYFVHGVPGYLKGLGYRCKWDNCWASIDKYPKFLADYGFDIGLAPLMVNEFNMGKSNLRYLEYSALGIPTIATSIEPYKNSIKQGKNGFLCSNTGEWVKSLETLIESPELRLKMGMEAKENIRKNYELSKVTDDYIDILEKMR